jgi:hypothetical protein
VWQADQHDEPTLAFNQGRDRAHVLPEDEVAFPVAGHSTIVCLWGTCTDVDRAAELALAVHDRMAERPTRRVTRAQMAGQFLP